MSSRSEFEADTRHVLERTRGATVAGLQAGFGSLRRALASPTASDVVTIVVTLSIALVVGSSLVGFGLAVLATGAGIAAAIVTACLASPRPIVRGFGGVLAVPVAVFVAIPSMIGLAFGLGISGSGFFASIALGALVYAGFAVTLVSWDRIGDGGVRRGATGTILAAVGIAGVVALRVLPEAGVRERAGAATTDTVEGIHGFVIVADGSWAPLSFFVLAIVTSVLVGRALSSLPLERLLPPDRRDSVSSALSHTRGGLSLVNRIAALGILTVLLAPAIVEDADAIPASPLWLRTEIPEPAGDTLATLVTASGFRLVLVALALVATCVLVADWIWTAVRRGLATTLATLFAPIIGGALVALVLARVLSDPAVDAELEGVFETIFPAAVAELIASFPAFGLAALVLVIAMGALASTLFTVMWLRILRILPPRAIGASLAACSVFVLAIGLAVVGRVESSIWTGAAAFVVWDLGEYADGIRTELGAEAATLRAELVHAGGSLLVGAVVGGGTIALYRWVATESAIVDPRLATVAVGAGVLTVALVTWVLRG